MISWLLRFFGVSTYRLPSLEGCPDTNHIRVRQIQADVNQIIDEFCLLKDPKGAEPCPACLHDVSHHASGFCTVPFIQTDINGIMKRVKCMCLMDPEDIHRNREAVR